MNIHKNARTTPQSRAVLVHRVLQEHWPVSAVAMAFGVSERTVYKWVARYRAEGPAGLGDRRSIAHRRPHALSPAWLALIRLLRQAKMVATEIAAQLPLARSTVSAALARLGLGRLRYLNPPLPAERYERQRPGELVHLDTKKLGRIERMGHRVTGNRRDSVDGAGWEFLFVAVDDHARIAFTQMKPDERRPSAIAFLRATVAHFAALGITVRRILTDNGSAFRSKRFARACWRLGLKHSFTRPYRPQTNGKAERFIQSALREWAYGIPYGRSSERTAMLNRWTHHYNWHRPHQGIGGVAPISRLKRSRNNLLTLHS
jgi:transposase InsO family protein